MMFTSYFGNWFSNWFGDQEEETPPATDDHGGSGVIIPGAIPHGVFLTQPRKEWWEGTMGMCILATGSQSVR